MPRGSSTPLQQSPPDRETGIVEVQKGQHAPYGSGIQKISIHAVHAHGISTAYIGIALGIRVEQIQNTALTDHGVIVEVLLERLPEPHGEFIERDVAGQQVVRPDDGRVASDVSGPYIAFLDNGDICHAMQFGEVIGSGEPVATASNNDYIVDRFWSGIAPC